MNLYPLTLPSIRVSWILAWQCPTPILNCTYGLSNCRHKSAVSLPTDLEVMREHWCESSWARQRAALPCSQVRTMRVCGQLPEDRLDLGVDVGCLHGDLHVRFAEGAAQGVSTLCLAASAHPAVIVTWLPESTKVTGWGGETLRQKSDVPNN